MHAAVGEDALRRRGLKHAQPGGVRVLQDQVGAPAERTARGTSLLDTRFTAEWLAAHPGDRALADMMAARRTAEVTAEQLRGAAEQLAARSLHDVWDRLHNITCPTLVASGRFDGAMKPGDGKTHKGCAALCLRGGIPPALMPSISATVPSAARSAR